ncbi:copper transporter 1-like [Curcuma longa]|uniref:copper transporter 1-like n=1 Tax=Curcuma longa TaxID=136217 RepID=UPI003D9F04DE
MAMGAGAGGDMASHDMGMMVPPPASSPAHPMGHGMGMMHMTFFWGQRTAILFSGWPGDRGLGMYLLALVFVLVLAVLEEALSAASQRFSWRQASSGGRRGPAEALLLTALHAVRLGLAYLVMLALMSFNGGVFLAAVVGHAIGFLLTRSGLLERQAARSGNAQPPPSAKKKKSRRW